MRGARSSTSGVHGSALSSPPSQCREEDAVEAVQPMSKLTWHRPAAE